MEEMSRAEALWVLLSTELTRSTTRLYIYVLLTSELKAKRAVHTLFNMCMFHRMSGVDCVLSTQVSTRLLYPLLLLRMLGFIYVLS